MSTNETAISRALTKALEDARLQEQEEGIRAFDIAEDKLIIFSDLHKGARNGADDFLASERAYNAALAYYFNEGYTLVSLGDMEELWEERPPSVLRAYERSLALEARFHEAERLIRIWGNHDDHWRYPAEVKKHLQKAFDSRPLKVREAQLLQVMKGEERLGVLLLLHGHQGTLDSDRYSAVSRVFVRYIWRPIQRLFKIQRNTPAKDWKLRHGHNTAMFDWSRQQEELVLVAGHTHRPVFESRTHTGKLSELLEEAKRELADAGDDPKLRRDVSQLLAELEWVRAQERQPPEAGDAAAFDHPSYFNTGCCCFLDGDITGIEIANGRIALIRWPNDDDQPLPAELESADLEKEVFAQI